MSRPPRPPIGTVTASCRTVPAQRSGDGRSSRPSWCELSGAGTSGARSDSRRHAARFSSYWFSLSRLSAPCCCCNCCRCRRCRPSSSSAHDGPGRGELFGGREGPPPPPPGSVSAFAFFNLTSATSATSPPRTPVARAAAASVRIPRVASSASAALLAPAGLRLCSPPGR